MLLFKSYQAWVLIFFCLTLIDSAIAAKITPRCAAELSKILPRKSNDDLKWYLKNTLKIKLPTQSVKSLFDNEMLKEVFAGRFVLDAPAQTPRGRQTHSHNWDQRWPQQIAWFRSFVKLRFEDPEAYEQLLTHAKNNKTADFWKGLGAYFKNDAELNTQLDTYMRSYYASWQQLRGQMSLGRGWSTAILEAFAMASAQTLPAESFNLNLE
jgi:hypothetical protein